MKPVIIVVILVITVLIIWYLKKIRRPPAATKCDPTSWANQCGDGDICQCTGPDKGWCTAPDPKKYAYGYSWGGAWAGGGVSSEHVACPDACAAAAKAAGHPNWVYQQGMSGEYPLNCTHGTITPGSCVSAAKGYTSDLSASSAPVCGGGGSGCKLPVGNGPGAFCLVDKDCPSGTTCEFADCTTGQQCVNMEGTCVNGKCPTGTCSNSGCNTDEDCMMACCVPFPCGSGMGCPNNGKCVKSANGKGFMCCGGGGCTPDGSTACKNGKCTAVGMVSMSCNMPGAFYPTTAQLAQMKAACASSPLGGACGVDFGTDGYLNGSCGRSCQDPTDPLVCYPKNLCWAVTGQTTLDSPTGACQSTAVTGGICFGS
jgi:hypothetical protein